MVDLTDLPRMIMPAALTELLREALAEISPPEGASDDRVAAVVSGPGGGSWHLGVSEGAFDLVEGVCEEPLLTLSVTVADWREFVAGRVRDVVRASAPPHLLQPSAITKLQGSGERAERLRAFSGDIQVILEDDEEDAEYCATLTLGAQPPRPDAPTTTVRLDLDYLAKLASGDENVQSAFFAGKIKIEGDMNLAMSVMTAMI